MKKLAFFLLLTPLPMMALQASAPSKLTAPELIHLATAKDAPLESAIRATFAAKDLKEGTAWISQGPDIFFAVESATEPTLILDDKTPGIATQPVSPSKVAAMQSATPADQQQKLWYATSHIAETGKNHAFHYLIDGKEFGGSLDMPAFGPLSYLQPGVPSGKLSDKITHTSKIYEGMKSNYWIYVPAQYDPKTPAALMVFQDGEPYATRKANGPWEHGILSVIDNLIAEKKIPVMICVFINPGSITDAPGTETYKGVKTHANHFKRTLDDAMRSTLYDTVSDRYVRFLRDEILADVGKQYNLRPDAYSRAITGASSGGICSFNAAWQMPDQFSRVLTWIGSFTSIQWHEHPEITDGGQDFPDIVIRGPHRNIRIWLQDGANDMENPNFGSWPLANLRMANALKRGDYDFHFSFGKGTHNSGQGAAEFPESMIWLWRDYDPSKTEQTYQQDPAEKTKPYFRVAVTNRSAE
jgi:enterochelin esterase family protein